MLDVYREVYADQLTEPFTQPERFIERLRNYAAAPGFAAVIGYVDDIPVGLAFGYTLAPDARWWRGLKTPTPEGFTAETGNRTFAVNEIMVRAAWRRHGVARALHEALIRDLEVERVTLLVEPDNEARHAYQSWGYEKVGDLVPGMPDAPMFDAMIRPL